jgi:Transglycosylase
MHVAVERVLKFVVGVVFALAVLFLILVYGTYLQGAREIPDDWSPTTNIYPDAVRRAWWRIEAGSEPVAIDELSPPGLALRWLGVAYAHNDRYAMDPDLLALGQAARLGQLRFHSRHHHLVGMAMTIRASHWPDDRVVDTILAQAYFGGEARGIEAGAHRVFARPLASLTEAEVALLISLMRAPAYFDPWCNEDRLRQRMATRAALSEAQIDAAFSRLPPRLAGSCR